MIIIKFLSTIFVMLLLVCFLTKYRGFIRKKTEEITGIKTVRNNVYQGGLEDQTYEGMIIEILLLIFLMGACLYLFLKGNVIWWGFMVPWIYPGIMILLRRNTFGEEGILPQTGMGYHPAYCFLIAYFSGLGIIMAGFGTLNFNLSILIILLGIGIQTVFMFPDYINRLVPFEIRSPIGHLFLAVLGIILSFLFIICFASFML